MRSKNATSALSSLQCFVAFCQISFVLEGVINLRLVVAAESFEQIANNRRTMEPFFRSKSKSDMRKKKFQDDIFCEDANFQMIAPKFILPNYLGLG